MKNYQKPLFELTNVIQKEQISSLADWLQAGGGQEYQQAGITTYVLES